MARWKKWLIGVGVVVSLLVLAGFVGYRFYFSDPVRSVFCRIIPCSNVDVMDGVCRVFAISELSTFDTPADRRAALLKDAAAEPDGDALVEAIADVLAAPASQRYQRAEALAAAAGAPRWTCPPMARVVEDLPAAK